MAVRCEGACELDSCRGYVVTALASTSITGVPLFRRGKVRDTYRLADGRLLMVATDRVSAFDVVMPTPVPDKGRVLTQMSRWWFARTASVVPNHLRDDLIDVLEAVSKAQLSALRRLRRTPPGQTNRARHCPSTAYVSYRNCM